MSDTRQYSIELTEDPELLTVTNEVRVDLLNHMGGDDEVIKAMLVSTKGDDSLDAEATPGRINFLMSNRHGTPFEHTSFTFYVAAPIFVFREFHRHRIGFCLSGETEIWCETISPNSGRTLRKRPIGWLYNNWHRGVTEVTGRTRMLESCRNFTVRTLDEQTGKFIISKVVNIYENGMKPLLRMTTDHGETIDLTGDHAVWTPEGWAKAGDLRKGDLIARSGKVPVGVGRQCPPALRRGIGVWTSMQRNSLITKVDECYRCGRMFDKEDLVLDHIVPVVTNLQQALDINNLAPCCAPCHREKTNAEQVLASGRGGVSGAVWTEIKSIRSVGQKMTYDLELEGPNRGFVANGLVVHNSYNEMSGRYTKLPAEFYVPGWERPLKQEGKPGQYIFVPEDDAQAFQETFTDLCAAYEFAYRTYERIMARGHAKEIARACLPVGIFSQMYVTCNARSLMSFLSLRTKEETSKFPSYPQYEIELVARRMETEFARVMPMTFRSFCDNGRVSP